MSCASALLLLFKHTFHTYNSHSLEMVLGLFVNWKSPPKLSKAAVWRETRSTVGGQIRAVSMVHVCPSTHSPNPATATCHPKASSPASLTPPIWTSRKGMCYLHSSFTSTMWSPASKKVLFIRTHCITNYQWHTLNISFRSKDTLSGLPWYIADFFEDFTKWSSFISLIPQNYHKFLLVIFFWE